MTLYDNRHRTLSIIVLMLTTAIMAHWRLPVALNRSNGWYLMLPWQVNFSFHFEILNKLQTPVNNETANKMTTMSSGTIFQDNWRTTQPLGNRKVVFYKQEATDSSSLALFLTFFLVFIGLIWINQWRADPGSFVFLIKALLTCPLVTCFMTEPTLIMLTSTNY